MPTIALAPITPDMRLALRRLEGTQISLIHLVEAGMVIDYMEAAGKRSPVGRIEEEAQLRFEALKLAVRSGDLKCRPKDQPINSDTVVTLAALRAYAHRCGPHHSLTRWLPRWCDVWIAVQRAHGANISFLNEPSHSKRKPGRPTKWVHLMKFWEDRVARNEVFSDWGAELDFLEQIAETLEPKGKVPDRKQLRDNFRPRYQKHMRARK